MITRSHGKLFRWYKTPGRKLCAAEAFLKTRENYCVGASSRFLRLKKSLDHVWYMPDPEGGISALILQSRQVLFPVFDKIKNIPAPRFLNRFLGKVRIHALQGLREDVELLELLMENQRYYAAERIDYELMGLDSGPRPEALRAGPANLVLRKPVVKDTEFLFALQSAYEQEEVLPENTVFNPAVCRYNLEHILSSEQTLVAELDNQVVGKINTSARSFTRYQVGGVYVRPDYRGCGIAVKMTAVFVRDLLAQGKGVSLFVKKTNNAALKVYRKAGFAILADYRITYY